MKQRDFKGVWIPKDIWLLPQSEMTWMEKLFFVEIDSLDNGRGCFASNSYFSDFFQISKSRCTEIIKSLEARGYIKIVLMRAGKKVSERVINVLKGGVRKTEQGCSENRTGVFGKPKDNNKGINNKDINIDVYAQFDEFWDLYDKKVDKQKCLKIWPKITDEEKEKIFAHIPLYKKSEPRKKFRKGPYSYLYNKSWEDEVIIEKEQLPNGWQRDPTIAKKSGPDGLMPIYNDDGTLKRIKR